MASPSSTTKGQWLRCKPAWGLQMAPDVSMCQAQQFCGWDVAYKKLGPPGIIHVVGYLHGPRRQRTGIFASNTSRTSGDQSQELLHKHQDVITPEYPEWLCGIISGVLTPSCPKTVLRPHHEKAAPCCKAPLGYYDTTHFLSLSASHGTSRDQIHCSGQGTHCPVPHRTSARDLTDYQTRSSVAPPEITVQLCLIIQEVWDDIPRE